MINHVINKLSFLIPATGYDEARDYQRKVKNWANQNLPFLINHHLDEINQAGDLVIYDKVEIEINQLPWNLSTEDWSHQFAKHIRRLPASVETLPLVLQQWVFYLKNGCFTRTSVFKTPGELERYILSLADKLTFHHFAAISPADITISFLQRIFFQHSEEVAQVLLEKLWQLSPLGSRNLYHSVLAGLTAQPVTITGLLRKLLQARVAGNMATTDAWLSSLESGKVFAKEDTEDAQVFNEVAFTPAESSLSINYIDCPNAGLVLLFPFLEKFFENCRLVQNHFFVDHASQEVAIQSLYFLATGEAHGGEEQLVLPKILCGTNVDDYVQIETRLPQHIIAEAADLLQSVIGHWDKLRNTSVDGFRETFITRGGKLSAGEAAWTLQVEAAGVDILLNSIPWGFRNYRLPWMTTNLVTEWY